MTDYLHIYSESSISNFISSRENESRFWQSLTFLSQQGSVADALKDAAEFGIKYVFVFHDDLDIDFRKIKAKFGGGSAGHNGIESIDKFIGKDYSRVRIGIGHPKKIKKVNNHVLEDFKEDEEERIKEITENIVKQVPTLIEKKNRFIFK